MTNLNKVRFYKKNNNDLFDNTYTEYTLGDNEKVNVRFALYKDIFTWIPTDVYTDNNGKFCISIDKENEKLKCWY